MGVDNAATGAMIGWTTMPEFRNQPLPERHPLFWPRSVPTPERPTNAPGSTAEATRPVREHFQSELEFEKALRSWLDARLYPEGEEGLTDGSSAENRLDGSPEVPWEGGKVCGPDSSAMTPDNPTPSA